jgi:hypothetical protein
MPEPEETLEQAQALWAAHAEGIRRDERAALALEQLAAAAARLRERMRAARMDRICRICGEHNGGGCCGASVARQVDPWLLLANRLLGCAAAPQHGDFTTCCFLGSHGCVLAIKPFLCVKYDCRELLASVDPRRLGDVRDAREALLDAWIAVENRLRELCGGES